MRQHTFIRCIAVADVSAGAASPTPRLRHVSGSTGSPAPTASFDVVVADHTGATSGKPQTVKVNVRG